MDHYGNCHSGIDFPDAEIERGESGKEAVVSGSMYRKILWIFEGLLGEEGKCYIPYLMSVGLFIGIANVIGLFGFKPPTKDLNCTIALALMSIILVEAAGIRAKV